MIEENLRKIFEGVPLAISEHPLFQVKRDRYSNLHNAFIENLNLDLVEIQQLKKLLNAAREEERLSNLTAYQYGYNDAIIQLLYSNLSKKGKEKLNNSIAV